MPRTDRGRRYGFTAIEIVAVLALAALVTGLSVLSLTSLGAKSEIDSVVDHIGYCDGLVRGAARHSHGAFRLIIDPQMGRIEQMEGRARADDTVPRVVYQLPRGIRLDRVLRVRDESFGSLEVPISASGLSRSYAVHVTGDGLGRWLVVLGFSGQVKQASGEREAMELLDDTPHGNDAG